MCATNYLISLYGIRVSCSRIHQYIVGDLHLTYLFSHIGCLPNREFSISSRRHSFSTSTSKGKSNSWSFSQLLPLLMQYSTICYLLLLSNYFLILIVVTSTHIYVQTSSIPVRDTITLFPVAPSLFPIAASSLLQVLCSFASVRPYFYSYVCVHIYTHA